MAGVPLHPILRASIVILTVPLGLYILFLGLSVTPYFQKQCVPPAHPCLMPSNHFTIASSMLTKSTRYGGQTRISLRNGALLVSDLMWAFLAAAVKLKLMLLRRKSGHPLCYNYPG